MDDISTKVTALALRYGATESRAKNYGKRAADASLLLQKTLATFLPLRVKEAKRLKIINDFEFKTDKDHIEKCVYFYFNELLIFKKEHGLDGDGKIINSHVNGRIETPQCGGIWFHSITQCPPVFTEKRAIGDLSDREFSFVVETIDSYAFYIAFHITCSHGKLKNNGAKKAELFKKIQPLREYLDNHSNDMNLAGLVGIFLAVYCMNCK